MQAAKLLILDLRPTIDLTIKPFPYPRPPIMPRVLFVNPILDGPGRGSYVLGLSLEWRNTSRVELPGWGAALRFEFAGDDAHGAPAFAVAPLPAVAPNSDGRLEVSITLPRRPLGVWAFQPIDPDCAHPRG